MDEPTTYGPGPFTGIAHRIAWQHQEIKRLRAALTDIADSEAFDRQAWRMKSKAREALNIHKHGEAK